MSIKEDLTRLFYKKTEINNLLNSKASSTHTHGNLQNNGAVGTSNNASKNVVTDSNGKITTEDKPSIPSKISDLTDDSDFISTSQTTGLIKNDGSVDTTSYSTFSGSYTDLTNKPSIPTDLSDLTDSQNIIPSDVSDLTDTQNTAFTPKSHTHSAYINPTIADNLTTNDATQVLSAKQGKVLNDLIGSAIIYINQ